MKTESLEEITKLKNKVVNLKQQVRNFQQSQKMAENKAAFSDADFSDDEFWKENKNKETDKILLALAKK